MTLHAGEPAPAFTLLDASGASVSLSDFLGKRVVLYFYPKDNTPGCTIEAMDFSALKKDFDKKKTVILGISKDSCLSHQKFIDAKKLTITLLSDPDSVVQKQYGVWRMKKFMGREFLGTIRSTFLIDSKGTILKIWDPVEIKGHAQDVLLSIL